MKTKYGGRVVFLDLETEGYTEVNTTTGVLHVNAPEAVTPDDDGPEPDVVVEVKE